ncbi:MAG: phosphatase PAP2 family protein, partial [Deltaproteobacteria bacterium]|nr:phosphatase PAP2 family protein [Deltaproteobacteria bacterium]
DDDVRDAARLHSFDSRRRAREASDVLLTTLTTYPVMFDALVLANWYHDRPDVAWNMAIIDIETMAIVASLQQLTNIVTHRERPYGSECGSDIEDQSQDCDGNNRFYSLFSGHASQSFTSAALTCSHHMNLPLYGGGAVEAVPCVAGFSLATFTAALRVYSDRHYFSDVVLGAAVGTTAGFVVPWLYYGSSGGADEAKGASPSWSATVVPTPTGLMVQGAF